MGFGKVFEVSSIHDRGVNEFLTELTKDIEDTEPETEASKGLKIAITGRPNVGKSSLLNAFAKKERAIVSDIPGTTRDVVTEVLDGQDIIIRMADTAGTRRPGKIGKAYKKGEPVEKYSNLRTKKEIEDSDVVLIVIDAKEGATTQDLHIAGDAKELGKGIILVINKWDLNEKRTQEQYLSILRRRFSFMIWVPAVFVSAKTGRNIDQIVEQAKLISENQNRQINTSRLNRIIQDFVLDNPPRGAKKVKPKVYFVAQTGVLPPTFTITVKHHDAVHFSWKRAVENELRRHFDFTGTPIRVELKPKNEKRY
jgi:GTP-binding protein